MTVIDHFNLRSFNLNLLLAFDALMQERSVTQAASRLKIRQPAMSHALQTLRMLFEDELFVRVGPAMQPTSHAEALSVRVRNILAELQDTLFQKQGFDPAISVREFRIGLSNELELWLLPRLIARLSATASGLRLLAKTASREQLRCLLDDGAIDLVIGCINGTPSWQRQELLFDETHLCAFNPQLISLPAPIELDDYLQRPHVLISLKDNLAGCLEDALALAGVKLNVVAAAPHLVALMATVAAAPMLTTLPSRIVRAYAPLFGLVVSPVPLVLGRYPISVSTHARSDRDPGTVWLKQRVMECSDEGDEAFHLGLGAHLPVTATSRQPSTSRHTKHAVRAGKATGQPHPRQSEPKASRRRQ